MFYVEIIGTKIVGNPYICCSGSQYVVLCMHPNIVLPKGPKVGPFDCLTHVKYLKFVKVLLPGICKNNIVEKLRI